MALQEDKANHIVESLVQFLFPHSTWTGLNALIHAQYRWLVLHFGDDDHALGRRRQAGAPYSQLVRTVVATTCTQRRPLPGDQGLPEHHGTLQIERAFADKAIASLQAMPLDSGLALLARVHGVWIVSCPEAIIRQAPEFAHSMRDAHTNDDLIQLMLDALEFRVILGHGG